MNKLAKWTVLGALILAPTGYVLADHNVTQGVGTTIFAFVCQVSKVCPTHVNIDSTGAENATATNPFRTDPTGTTAQPVTQSGSWVFNPGNTVNTTPWLVTVANPLGSPANVTLTGTSTVTANAGTNLNTSALALEAGGNLALVAGSFVAQASTTSAQKGVLTQCGTTNAAPTYATATTNPVSCDTAGNMRVNVSSATGLGQASTTASQSGSLVMGASTTTLPSYGNGQTNALTTDLVGNLRVSPEATTAGGATPFHAVSAANNNATNIKTSAGTVYNLSLVNTSATVYYFKFFNQSTTLTNCNTDSANVVWSTAVAGLATGYSTQISFPVGLNLSSGIAFCMTGAIADNDNSNAATGITISIAYK